MMVLDNVQSVVRWSTRSMISMW